MELVFLVFLFFLTGYSSLTYQVAWNKILSQTVGVDSYSNTIIVAIFMLGLGLGSYAGSLLSKRTRRHFLWFLLAEIGVSCFAIVSPYVLRAVPAAMGLLTSWTGIRSSLGLDFFLNLLTMLFPTILMGLTLPLVTHIFRHRFTPGSTVGFLYSVNILGAAVGAFVSGVYTLGTYGIKRTIWSVAVLNLLAIAVGMICFWGKLRDSSEVEKVADRGIGFRPVFVVSFLIGVVALSYEILYFRVLVYYLSATAYVFPIVLTNYLVLMFLGNLLSAQGYKWGVSSRTLVAVSVMGMFVATPIIFLVPNLLDVLHLDQIRSVSDLTFRTFYGSLTFSHYLKVAFLLAFIGMLPVLFISMLFPVIVHVITTDRQQLGGNVGAVYLVQTYGNFAGVVLTGFVFLPFLGTIATSKALLALFAGACGLLLVQVRKVQNV